MKMWTPAATHNVISSFRTKKMFSQPEDPFHRCQPNLHHMFSRCQPTATISDSLELTWLNDIVPTTTVREAIDGYIAEME